MIRYSVWMPNSLRHIIVASLLAAALNTTSLAQTTSIRYEPASGEPENLAGMPNGLFFSADDGVYGRELWYLDGVHGEARLVLDIRPGVGGSIIRKIVPSGDLAVVSIGNPGSSGLIVSDGTRSGTKDHAIEQDGIIGMIRLNDVIGTLDNGRIAFTTLERGNIRGVWSLDPRESSPVPMVTPDEYGHRVTVDNPTYAILGNRVVFPGSKPVEGGRYMSGIRITNGTPEGSFLIREFRESPAVIFRFTDDLVLFEGNTEEMGSELWITDGTPEGTRLLKEIWPGPKSSSPGEFVVMPSTNTAYFAADDPEHGRELWVTDGTPEGTRMVKDIHPGRSDSEPYKLHHTSQKLFFIASTPGRGRELWVSRGTEESTFMLKDINPGPNGSEPYAFCLYGESLFFSALNPEYGEELWRSDGTPEGTFLLADINPGPESSYPYYTTVADGHIFFAATHQLYGRELWVTNGSTSGTRMISDVWKDGQVNPSSSPNQMTSTPKLLFFAADDVKHGMELWATDGTHEGTRMVRDIFPGRASSSPQEFMALDELVFFSADNGTHGTELWVSDGSELGTKMVANIADSGGSGPTQLTRFRDKVVFRAYSEATGTEVYIADSTGAEILSDIFPGPGDSNPSDFTVWQDKLYFRADDGVHGEELWVSTGQKNETRMVTDIIAVPVEEARISDPAIFQDGLFFARGNLSNGRELWMLPADLDTPMLVRDIAVPSR